MANDLISNLYSVFEVGGDLNEFFSEKASWIKDDGKQFWAAFEAFQFWQLASCIDQYVALLQKFLEVARELHLKVHPSVKTKM